MEKRTVIDTIEVRNDGTVQVRFAKQITDDDGTILSNQWHRAAMMPGDDIDAQMSTINADLTSRFGFPAVSAADINRLKAVTSSAV